MTLIVSDGKEKALLVALFVAVSVDMLCGVVPQQVIGFSVVSAASALQIQIGELTDDADIRFKLRYLQGRLSVSRDSRIAI